LKDIFSRVAQQVRLHKMQVIASGVGVAAVPVAAIIYWLLIVDQEGPRTFTVDQSLAMLDRGDWERTRYMATHLERAVLDDPDHWGARSFVLGATIASEAATMEERDRRTFSQLAIRYLSRSRRRRFPPGRVGQGLFLLGRAMYFVGRYEDARQVLSESLKHNPPSPIKIRGLIAATYLRDPNPDYEQALQNYKEYLQDPGLTAEDRFAAQIDRCWALYYSNQIEAAEKCLE